MPITLAEMMQAGRETAPTIASEEAMKLLESGDAIAVDVREKFEVKVTGKVTGAIAVPRSRIEFKADPDSPHFDPAIVNDKALLLYCRSE